MGLEGGEATCSQAEGAKACAVSPHSLPSAQRPRSDPSWPLPHLEATSVAEGLQLSLGDNW
jgi:hypothetical protein